MIFIIIASLLFSICIKSQITFIKGRIIIQHYCNIVMIVKSIKMIGGTLREKNSAASCRILSCTILFLLVLDQAQTFIVFDGIQKA